MYVREVAAIHHVHTLVRAEGRDTYLSVTLLEDRRNGVFLFRQEVKLTDRV